MTKAVRYDEFGGIEVLRVDEIDRPVPGDEQVLVRVKAAGINPGEAAIRTGAMADIFPSTFPSGQGSDLAGVVAEVGAGVDRFSVGDEVIGFSLKRAAQAELVLVDVDNLTPKPRNVSWEVAGGLFVAGVTAWGQYIPCNSTKRRPLSSPPQPEESARSLFSSRDVPEPRSSAWRASTTTSGCKATV
jgi:NADPH:quinone reductase-like Zn-dependent oxidoreductase